MATEVSVHGVTKTNDPTGMMVCTTSQTQAPVVGYSSITYALYTIRVATAQGKQGIWLLTFPDRENTGNLVNLFFYTRKMVPTQGKFWNFLKILLLKWQQGDGAFLS